MAISDEFFDMQAAPMRIGTVRLKVRDLGGVATFYEDVLGLARLDADAGRVTLGSSATPLLELVGDPALARNDRRQAGLFHTAFLMPTRADLARWLDHALTRRLPLHGASDHIVSEAIYLADPEGNGIEVYVDRPVSHWHDTAGDIRMATDQLDVQALLRTAGATEWAGFPDAGMIGHVHLQVGDTAEADRFYRDLLGLDITARYPGASFYGIGGYHHQLAGNIWNSRRAGKRPAGMGGLDAVEIIIRDSADIAAIAARAESAGIANTTDVRSLSLRDPWGTVITFKTQGAHHVG